MAAILELVLGQKITTEQLIAWLVDSDTSSTDIPTSLLELSNLKQEFVPFFLNYLRDQTFQLLQSAKSACPSPAKTPTSLNYKQRKQSARPDNDSVSTPINSKRVQLFASPADTTESSRNNYKKAPSPYGADNYNQGKNNGYGKKNRSSPHTVNDTSQRRKSGGSRTFTPEVERSKNKYCIGDFLVTPEHDTRRQRHSPQSGGRKDSPHENLPSPQPGRRSSGKRGRNSSEQKKLRRITPVSAPPVFSLSNLDDFPPMGGSPAPKKEVAPSRRITPTLLTPVSQSERNAPSSTVFSSSSSNPAAIGGSTAPGFRSPPQATRLGLDEERELLRQERAKRTEATPTKTNSAFSTVPITPTKASLERMSSVLEVIQADRDSVNHANKLTTIAQLYCACLEGNLVPNLTVELFFIVQLLTVRVALDSEPIAEGLLDVDEINFFNSVHNAVFFSICVLEKQQRLYGLLDRGTLRLLADNPRVADFSIHLKDQLMVAHQTYSDKVSPMCWTPSVGGVSFQVDTDNRSNFPSDKSFQVFKKQRDLFYELIREWEAQHVTAGWSMQEVLGGRIRGVIWSLGELASHMHFARLFQAQLISMCKGGSNFQMNGDDENIALLANLKQTNPDKYKRLLERFIAPQTVGGPCPAPSFPGCQEFFHDFIIAAASPTFNQILINSMTTKILELNSAQFVFPESDEMEHEQRESFASCLLTLRLLAKFLGLVAFLPYQAAERLPDAMQSSFITMRNQIPQSLDIVACLEASDRTHRRTLTVPWVIEYLSMMDAVAPYTDFFKKVIALLLQIYRSSCKKFFQSGHFSQLLVIVSTGWLFENPVLPEGFFFTDPGSICGVTNKQDDAACLDSLDLVDHQLLYTCCPYLGELRSLLMEFAMGSSSRSNNIRKITPVSAERKPVTSVSKKPIQLQLEENFFHNHPSSLNRTVEFVAERVASNYVKNYRNITLPRLLRQGVEKAQSLGCLTVGSPERVKEKRVQLLNDIAARLAVEGRVLGVEDGTSYCSEKVPSILRLILPEELSEQVALLSVQISCRLANDKVRQWLETHITTNMLSKELSTVKVLRGVLGNSNMGSNSRKMESPPTEEVNPEPPHDLTGIPPSDLLNMFKTMQKSLVLRKSVEYESVLEVLESTKLLFNTRQDIIPAVTKSLAVLSVDLAGTLIALYPHLYRPDTEERLLGLWQSELKAHVVLSSAFCSRYIFLIEGTTNKLLSWEKYCIFLRTLFQLKLVKLCDLENTCQKLIQMPLPLDTLEQLASCMCKIYEVSLARGVTSCDMEGLLDWFYQLCGEESAIAPCLLQSLMASKRLSEEQKHARFDQEQRAKSTDSIDEQCEDTTSSMKLCERSVKSGVEQHIKEDVDMNTKSESGGSGGGQPVITSKECADFSEGQQQNPVVQECNMISHRKGVNFTEKQSMDKEDDSLSKDTMQTETLLGDSNSLVDVHKNVTRSKGDSTVNSGHSVLGDRCMKEISFHDTHNHAEGTLHSHQQSNHADTNKENVIGGFNHIKTRERKNEKTAVLRDQSKSAGSIRKVGTHSVSWQNPDRLKESISRCDVALITPQQKRTETDTPRQQNSNHAFLHHSSVRENSENHSEANLSKRMNSTSDFETNAVSSTDFQEQEHKQDFGSVPMSAMFEQQQGGSSATILPPGLELSQHQRLLNRMMGLALVETTIAGSSAQ